MFYPLNKQLLPYSALVVLSTTIVPNTANSPSFFDLCQPVDFIDRLRLCNSLHSLCLHPLNNAQYYNAKHYCRYRYVLLTRQVFF